jgi:hypothetical protein
MATNEEKLEKVLYLNNKDIGRVNRRFTGKVVVNWFKGEPMDEAEEVKGKIKLD